MKLSKLVGDRFKERPANCLIDSHALMVRGGYIKNVANGIYSQFPPMKRISQKIENIIRDEMDKLDGQEVLFPVALPGSLWEESGRYESVGSELLRFTDRTGSKMVLGMTHEEASVQLVREYANSYAKYPFMIYQIQTKFRDEARPRAGLIRVREFTMTPYKTFCARFEKPIVQDEDANAVRRLNQFTGPFILRRMKSEVLRELPPKTENVRRVELETEQRKLYLAAVVDAREKLRAAKPEDKMTVFAVLMRLREICCDPRLVADNWTGSSAKLEACLELVTEAVAGGHRILLFSQFTSMLELLAKRLDEAGVSHFTLQGSTPKPVRAEQVRRFNQGEADVFLISLRAGGTGLNLTAADIVIHYDPWWNLAAQNQATDRAYRIGQRNPVQVYRLIAQDTIEEKIVELQQAKQSLADTVTGGADGAILSMNPEQLLQLLGEEA